MLRKIFNQFEEGFLSLLVFFEVILRFVFNTGLLWAQELTLHLSAWFVLFGVSYGVKVGAHIGVDAVVRLLPPLARRLTGAFAVLLSLTYCGLFLYGSWVYLARMYKIGIGLEDVEVPFGHALPEGFAWDVLGLLLLAARLLELLWGIFKGTSYGFSFADEAKESMHIAEQAKAESGSGEQLVGGSKS